MSHGSQMIWPDAEAIGPALKLARLSRGLSREQLGVLAGGVSASSVGRIERSQVRAHRSTLSALVQALDEDILNDRERPAQALSGKAGNTDAHGSE
jgi:transcriptional regulator with XRE-family HTH domain